MQAIEYKGKIKTAALTVLVGSLLAACGGGEGAQDTLNAGQKQLTMRAKAQQPVPALPSCAAAWDPNAAYAVGAVTSEYGANYTAVAANQNSEPVVYNGDGQPWSYNGYCSSLNKSAAPSGNLSLAGFSLQLPTGASGNPTIINGATLANNYTDSPYFYTDANDGAMVMMDPTVGWATSGSTHPRVELRETGSWDPNATNIMDATLMVAQVPSKTTVGQVFQATGPSKPLAELEVTSAGAVTLLLENDNQGGTSTTYTVGAAPIGTAFSYELQVQGTLLYVTVNGQQSVFEMDSSFVGENFYFKAGNYDQTATTGTPLTTPGTIVKFYYLNITH